MITEASATALARGIREGRWSSREVVGAHVDRLRAFQPRTNAVVVPLYDRALQAAAEADERRGDDGLGPLHGVPCTIKEAFAVEGLPNTSGLAGRVGQPATTTAPTVRRLLDAGAIPLGLTNTSELCMWFESYNRVYGRTSSAYSARRTAGGSSGGEGAAVGSGGSPFGLGSDVGGSIRMPAFFNGVFGHKPSPGIVPNAGQWPPGGDEITHLLATGPLARRAEDLMPLTRILAADRADRLGDPATVSLPGLPVIAVDSAGALPVRPNVRAGLHRAAAGLREAGATVTERRFRSFLRAFELWSAALGTAHPTPFAELLGGGERIPAARLVSEFVTGRSPHTFPSILLALAEGFSKLAPARARRLVERGRELKGEIEAAIGDGVLLYPPHPRVAPIHRRALINPFAASYTMIFNVLGLPVTQVPMGLDSRGLPTGVQVVARAGNDHVAIAAALELERRFGGWTPPA